MRVYANAKINLGLDVVGIREDGYHLLDMVMVPLTLADDIDIEFSEKDCFSSNTSLAWDKGNLIYRAVQLMRDHYGLKEHFCITLNKRIPLQAGLAGGSADCAAVLRGINELCRLGRPVEELMELGIRLGADVPFCLYNKPARVQGIGEIIKPIEIKKHYYVLLVKPDEGLSTAEVFRRYDSGRHADIDKLVKQLEQGEEAKLDNVLEDSAFRLMPEIEAIKDIAITFGHKMSLMSGSGSCVFVLSKDRDSLIPVYTYFKKIYKYALISEIAPF